MTAGGSESGHKPPLALKKHGPHINPRTDGGGCIVYRSGADLKVVMLPGSFSLEPEATIRLIHL
jgi:hypothetical protein